MPYAYSVGVYPQLIALDEDFKDIDDMVRARISDDAQPGDEQCTAFFA